LEKIKYHTNKLKIRLLIIFENFITNYIYKMSNEILEEIILINRDYLKTTASFLEKEQFQINDYGMDRKIYSSLDSEIKNYPTYTDIIAFISGYLAPAKINYLEIGASVLKNFMQLDHYFKNSNLVAYDINSIVPKYKENFSPIEGSANSETGIFLKEGSNSCYYFKGSVLNKEHIDNFNSYFDNKFNLVFSDALHTPEGVKSEYDNIISERLDENFILYFDDLDFPGLLSTAKDIYDDLIVSQEKVYFTTFKVYGWVGQHEKMHTNGIISTIDFYNEFKLKKINLPFRKEIN
jgi:hypothetical protein